MYKIEDLKKLSIAQIFLTLLDYCFERSRHTQKCPAISDELFIQLGVQRIMERVKSGREFLQKLDEEDDLEITRSSFFSTLQSQRRLLLTEEITQVFYELMQKYFEQFDVDFLKEFPELNDYQVWAGDGHYIDHACHTGKDSSGKNYGAGTLYAQDLRTGLMHVVTAITDGSRKNHEMPLFRRAVEKIKAKKILWVLDRAYIDKAWWAEQSKLGQNVIVLVKEGSVVIKKKNLKFDATKEINTGVQSVYIAQLGKGGPIHKIVEYEDPETGNKYRYMCTVKGVEPGLVAWLYQMRWRIEKSYDTYKNDLYEQKAWATGKTALKIQSHMIAMTYNLLRFVKEFLNSEEDIEDTKVEEKFTKNLDIREKKAKIKGRSIHPFLRKMPRMAKLSSQFIRAFKNYFYQEISLTALIPKFRRRMEVYL